MRQSILRQSIVSLSKLIDTHINNGRICKVFLRVNKTSTHLKKGIIGADCHDWLNKNQYFMMTGKQKVNTATKC